MSWRSRKGCPKSKTTQEARVTILLGKKVSKPGVHEMCLNRLQTWPKRHKEVQKATKWSNSVDPGRVACRRVQRPGQSSSNSGREPGRQRFQKSCKRGGLMQCDRLERAKAWMNQGSWRPVNPSLPLQKPFKSAKAAGRACSYLYLPGYDRSLKIERTLTNTAYVSTGNAELSHGRGHSCLKPLLHLRWSESRTNISIQCT